jgi:hypothetical protein
LKQQILDATDKAHLAKLSNNLTGCNVVTVGELLNHLVTRCCQIKCDGTKGNKKKLGAEWSPAASLEELWIHARECQELAFLAQGLLGWTLSAHVRCHCLCLSFAFALVCRPACVWSHPQGWFKPRG